ncbi:MAG: DUF3786 domain-containing protein [Candidatus Helarchaeota archaeon]
MDYKQINPKKLVSMRQFEGGWIWVKNIDEFSKIAISSIEKNDNYDLNIIVDILNGKLIKDWKLYSDTEWIIYINPFLDIYLLFIYNKNEEFGSEIKVFFNKKFLDEIPTEDAYCIVELYLKQLNFLINSPELIKMRITGDIISIDELLEIVNKSNKEKLKYEILEIRSDILKKIPFDIITKIGINLNGKVINGNWNNIKIDWGLIFSPLRDVEIYIIFIRGSIQVYYSSMALKFQSRDILFFTWLYCNAIIREARKIMGDKIPKLSKYL